MKKLLVFITFFSFVLAMDSNRITSDENPSYLDIVQAMNLASKIAKETMQNKSLEINEAPQILPEIQSAFEKLKKEANESGDPMTYMAYTDLIDACNKSTKITWAGSKKMLKERGLVDGNHEPLTEVRILVASLKN